MMKNMLFIVLLTISNLGIASENISNLSSNIEGESFIIDTVTQVSKTFIDQTTPIRMFVSEKAYLVATNVKSSVPYALIVDKITQVKQWVFSSSKVEHSSSKKVEGKLNFTNVWNAPVFGYNGAGKYVVVSTAAAVAIVAAYAAYCFSLSTLEQQIIALVDKAQANSNIVLQELPGILAQCSNDDERVEILHYVLSRVVITPEIAATFNL